MLCGAFPGLYCPGLIEAQRRDSAFVMRCGFRGSIAPASLKPCPFGTPSGVSRAFPGLYCPGLIEASAVSGEAGEPGWFPGLYCPGLIEATACERRSDHGGSVSGALLPRPH